MSSADLLVRYARERLRFGFFAVVAGMLGAAGGFLRPGAALTLASVLTSGLAIFFLIMAFRIWDDLEDREHDRVHHPDRIIAKTDSTTQFALLGLVFLSLGIALLFAQQNAVPRIVALGIVAGVTGVWYRVRKPSTRRTPGLYLVLIKYPVFTYAAAPGPLPSLTGMWPRGFVILAAIYVAICIYETFDDGELRASYTGASLP